MLWIGVAACLAHLQPMQLPVRDTANIEKTEVQDKREWSVTVEWVQRATVRWGFTTEPFPVSWSSDVIHHFCMRY